MAPAAGGDAQSRRNAIKTLIVFADEDAVTPDHIVEFWKALGGGRGEAGLNGQQRSASCLAIMANANHSTAASSPVFVDAVRSFLAR